MGHTGLSERAGGRRGRRRGPMSHVPKRLASTATKVATLSTAHLKAFPPPEAIVGRTPSSSQTERPSFFSAETWATLQPPNPASLSAFAHRIGLAKTLSNPAEAIQQACTHPSFVPFHARHNPNQPAITANGNLSTLGNSLLGLFATEHVNATFPHLPTRVMKAAVSAYVGPSSCANIAKEMGVGHILRWNRTVSPQYRLFYTFVTLSRGCGRLRGSPRTSLSRSFHYVGSFSAHTSRNAVDQAVIEILVFGSFQHISFSTCNVATRRGQELLPCLRAAPVFV